MHQLERNHLKLMIVAAGNIKEVIAAVSKSMREILVGEGLHEIVEFEIEFMDTIPPGSKTSKTRMIISRVGRPRMG